VNIKDQYERFPYPPISALALPRKDQGQGLKYEAGAALVRSPLRSVPSSHKGMRILVAGCGTLEALVVAQAHPQASEVVAIDISEASLSRFKKRLALAKVVRFPFKIPKITTLCLDLTQRIEFPSQFDYIVCSNVIHHVAEPARMLNHLASLLKGGGLLRMVTYPKGSRLWMRETSRWLRLDGLMPGTPGLVRRARKRIGTLPKEHPIRSCFESQPEAHSPTGIVDAFLNACENPLHPLEWKVAAQNAGLVCVGETQTASSRSSFLWEVVPSLKCLPSWESLQVLDDLLEVCANPVLWFCKSEGVAREPQNLELSDLKLRPTPAPESEDGVMPSRIYGEMKQNLLRCQALLEKFEAPIGVAELFSEFKTRVGPRVDAVTRRPLAGLSITDHSFEEIMAAAAN